MNFIMIFLTISILSFHTSNSLTTQEKQLLSEIAICAISEKANWNALNSLFSSNTYNINPSNIISDTDDLITNNIITSTQHDTNMDLSEIWNIKDDVEGGLNFLSTGTIKQAEQQAIFTAALNQPMDPDYAQILRYKDILNNRPKVYNIKTGKYYNQWGKEQDIAERNLREFIDRMNPYKPIKPTNIGKELSNKVKQRVTSNAKATKQVIKNQRMTAFKDKLKFGTKLTAGISAIINIQLLIDGEIWGYATSIGKDLAINALCTGTTVALEETVLEDLAPGAGVIVFGMIDAVQAAKTGDWSRFGLNIVLNTGSAIGAAGGAQAGISIGSSIYPGIGTVVGGILGGLIGGIGARLGLGQTPLGGMTEYEDREAVRKLAEELNPQLSELGVELDTSKSFKELQEILKREEIPLRFRSEFVNANGVSFGQISNILGDDVIDDILKIASSISPEIRIEGLKQVKRALGC